jgi:hypothetical protein
MLLADDATEHMEKQRKVYYKGNICPEVILKIKFEF